MKANNFRQGVCFFGHMITVFPNGDTPKRCIACVSGISTIAWAPTNNKKHNRKGAKRHG